MPSAMYLRSMLFFEKFVPQKLIPLWKHPAGPQTVFFWAPAFKWGLTVAGIADFGRPAETISIPQSGALAVTGIIWTRYGLVIVPKNYSLAIVNVFVALTHTYNCARAVRHKIIQKQN